MAKKNNNIQFQSNTNKYEKDTRIHGSDVLYLMQTMSGTNRNLRDEYIDYLTFKSTGVQPKQEEKNVGAYFWKVYKKPENMPYDEFVKAVNNGTIRELGNSPITILGRQANELDINGNYLCATINSNLQDEMDECGNMLIDGTTGEVLRKPTPSIIINKADDRTGFYLVEQYKSTLDKLTGNQVITDKQYNFLDTDGKLISKNTYFNRANFGEKLIKPVYRNFYARDGKSVINSYDIYPMGYIYNEGQDFMYLESDLRLVIENKYRVSKGLAPIDNLDNYHIERAGKRLSELNQIVEQIGMSYDLGEITDETYSKIMGIINDEFDKAEEFKAKYATDEEIKLFENAQESGDKSIYDVNQETLKKLGYDLTGLEDFQTDELEK